MENFWLFYKYFYYRVYKWQLKMKRIDPKLDAWFFISLFQTLILLGIISIVFPYDRINGNMKYLNLNYMGVILFLISIILSTLIINYIKIHRNFNVEFEEMFENNPNVPNFQFDFLIFLHILLSSISIFLW